MKFYIKDINCNMYYNQKSRMLVELSPCNFSLVNLKMAREIYRQLKQELNCELRICLWENKDERIET